VAWRGARAHQDRIRPAFRARGVAGARAHARAAGHTGVGQRLRARRAHGGFALQRSAKEARRGRRAQLGRDRAWRRLHASRAHAVIASLRMRLFVALAAATLFGALATGLYAVAVDDNTIGFVGRLWQVVPKALFLAAMLLPVAFVAAAFVGRRLARPIEDL